MSINNKSILSNIDSHAAVARRIDNEWWILDAAEDGPINVTKDEKAAREYFSGIDFVNFFGLEIDKPRSDAIGVLKEKWFEFLDMKEADLPKSKIREFRP